MDGAIYALSRKVEGDHGELFMQNVTVFADSPSEARAIVDDEFARLRKASGSEERPYMPTPPWHVEKISLDQHKVITADIT
ncbi:MAG: hypothetical protein E6G45_01105 [Actinobacteria bacterium]|nr:MAG: hypothetical protein E6G45_01105 [Actinomycetota bacterium]